MQLSDCDWMIYLLIWSFFKPLSIKEVLTFSIFIAFKVSYFHHEEFELYKLLNQSILSLDTYGPESMVSTNVRNKVIHFFSRTLQFWSDWIRSWIFCLYFSNTFVIDRKCIIWINEMIFSFWEILKKFLMLNRILSMELSRNLNFLGHFSHQ